MILLDQTEKFFFLEENEAEALIEERKKNENGILTSYKLSTKDTKDLTYYIVELKTCFCTLKEAKEA